MTINLKHGDCLELMKDIPDKSIDMILCDLPYGTTDAKWDIIIPFEDMWDRILSVITENAPIILFGTEPFSSKLRLSRPDLYRYDWYWQKDNGSNFLFGNKMPMKVIETASVFYAKQPIYNPQKIANPKGESKNWLSYHKRNNTDLAKTLFKSMPPKPCRGKSYEPDKLLPKNLVYFAREHRDKVHPTQKPVSLLEYLIITYTNCGQNVLDFTMGSGSTGVACVNTKRNFIGIELDENYFEIAKKRIDDRIKEIEVEKANSLF